MPTETIREKWDRADAAEATAESLKWEVARELSERHEQGEKMRALAEETGRLHQRVSEFIAAYREFGRSGPAKLTFNQAIDAVKGRTNEGERKRKDESATRKVLSDPDQRQKVLASLSTDDLAAVTEDAFDAEEEKRKAARKAEKAKRRDQGTTERPFHGLVFGRLAKADREIRDAIRQAREANWTAAESERLRARTDKTREYLDLLIQVAEGVDDVDWDDELHRLLSEAQEIERER